MTITWTHRRAVVGLVAAAAVIMLGAVRCSGDDAKVAARITVDGRAEIGAPGDDIDDVSGERSIRFGERVRLREGMAVVDLAGDSAVELRPGSQIELVPVNIDGTQTVVMSLRAGDLLVNAPGDPVRVSVSGGTDVVVRGTARVSKGLSLAVGTYSGTVELASAGSNARVDGLRQMVVPAAGLFPLRPSPLQYLASDSWDRRLLGDVIELSNELLARSQGFSAQVAGPEGGVEFFKALLPGLASEPAFDPALLTPQRPLGETLVGAAIVIQGTRGTFTERWQNVFSFRDEGAQWGLVAADQGVTRVPLLAEVDAAVGRGPAIFGIPLPNEPATPGTGSSGTGGRRPSGPGTGSGGTTGTSVPGTGGGSPPTAPGQAPADQPGGPGPVNTGSPPVDNTVNSLVETLSGLLRALGLS